MFYQLTKLYLINEGSLAETNQACNHTQLKKKEINGDIKLDLVWQHSLNCNQAQLKQNKHWIQGSALHSNLRHKIPGTRAQPKLVL